MSLSKDQIQMLLKVVANSGDDSLDCDRCFDYVAQFAETQLSGRDLCESMKLVQTHLRNCPCCKDEFEALMAAMSEIDGPRNYGCTGASFPPPNQDG